jgi:hypothetical protein
MADVEYMEKMRNDLVKLMDEWCRQNPSLNPSAIGATLMTTALMIYRTSLSDEDYNGMVDMISESRHMVVPFNLFDKSKLN